MDAELLHNILHRLEKLEQLIIDRQNTTHNRYAEILVSIEEVKTSVAEIKTESKSMDKRVSVLEENKTWANRLLIGTMVTSIFSLVVSLVIRLI